MKNTQKYIANILKLCSALCVLTTTGLQAHMANYPISTGESNNPTAADHVFYISSAGVTNQYQNLQPYSKPADSYYSGGTYAGGYSGGISADQMHAFNQMSSSRRHRHRSYRPSPSAIANARIHEMDKKLESLLEGDSFKEVVKNLPPEYKTLEYPEVKAKFKELLKKRHSGSITPEENQKFLDYLQWMNLYYYSQGRMGEAAYIQGYPILNLDDYVKYIDAHDVYYAEVNTYAPEIRRLSNLTSKSFQNFDFETARESIGAWQEIVKDLQVAAQKLKGVHFRTRTENSSLLQQFAVDSSYSQINDQLNQELENISTNLAGIDKAESEFPGLLEENLEKWGALAETEINTLDIDAVDEYLSTAHFLNIVNEGGSSEHHDKIEALYSQRENFIGFDTRGIKEATLFEIEGEGLDLDLIFQRRIELDLMAKGEGELSVEPFDALIDAVTGESPVLEGKVEADIEIENPLTISLTDVATFSSRGMSEVLDVFEQMHLAQTASPFSGEGDYMLYKLDIDDASRNQYFRGRVIAGGFYDAKLIEKDRKFTLHRVSFTDGEEHEERIRLSYSDGYGSTYIEANFATIKEYSNGHKSSDEQKEIYTNYIEQKLEVSNDVAPGRVREVISTIVDFIPVLGTVKAVIEAGTSVNVITGERVDPVVSGFAAAVSIIPIPGSRHLGAAIGKGIARVTGSSSRAVSKVLGNGQTRKVVESASRQVTQLRRKIVYDIKNFKLSAHEGGLHRGHTIDRHIGKTYNELAEREIPFSSTFFSKKEAEACIQEALEKNALEIEGFIRNGTRQRSYTIELPFDRIIGKGIDSNGVKSEALNKARVVIQKNKDTFKIKTAYPIQ